MTGKHLNPRLAAKIRARCVCARLRSVTRAISRHYDAALRPVGLSAAQLESLMILKAHGDMCVRDMAEMLDADRTTVSRNLRPLSRRRLIRMRPGGDRRERVVSLTHKAVKLLVAAVPCWEQAQSRIENSLGREHVERLLDTLTNVAASTS